MYTYNKYTNIDGKKKLEVGVNGKLVMNASARECLWMYTLKT